MIEWRMTGATQFRFQELMLMLQDTDEDSEDYVAIRESIKSLPGYPHHPTGDLDPDSVHIMIMVTDVQN